MQASLEKRANSRKRSKLLTRSARLLFENIPTYYQLMFNVPLFSSSFWFESRQQNSNKEFSENN